MNENTVLGIDVAKDKGDVVLLLGDKIRRRAFGNKPTGHGKLLDWLTRHNATDCPVCLEATGVYGEELAVFLHGHKVRVSVAAHRGP